MQKLTKMRRVAISCNLQSFCRLLLLFWKQNEETEIKSYICISENKHGKKKTVSSSSEQQTSSIMQICFTLLTAD